MPCFVSVLFLEKDLDFVASVTLDDKSTYFTIFGDKVLRNVSSNMCGGTNR